MTRWRSSVLEMFSDGRTEGTSVFSREKQATISSASDDEELEEEEEEEEGLAMRPPLALAMPWMAAKVPKRAAAAAAGEATIVLAFILIEELSREKVDIFQEFLGSFLGFFSFCGSFE